MWVLDPDTEGLPTPLLAVVLNEGCPRRTPTEVGSDPVSRPETTHLQSSRGTPDRPRVRPPHSSTLHPSHPTPKVVPGGLDRPQPVFRSGRHRLRPPETPPRLLLPGPSTPRHGWTGPGVRGGDEPGVQEGRGTRRSSGGPERGRVESTEGSVGTGILVVDLAGTDTVVGEGWAETVGLRECRLKGGGLKDRIKYSARTCQQSTGPDRTLPPPRLSLALSFTGF